MKKLFIILLIVLFPMTLYAVDGEICFGKYFNSDYRANPNEGKALYISSIELGHIMSIFRPYIKLETLVDKYEPKTSSVDPSSIKYYLGTTVNITENIDLELSHMCWHSIDSFGNVEQYNVIKIRTKF